PIFSSQPARAWRPRRQRLLHSFADGSRAGSRPADGRALPGRARRLGFRAMQFNFVVSTNQPAIRLWQQLGFAIIGTVPGAFRRSQHGLVDTYVMFRTL